MVHDRNQIDPTNEISAFRINTLHVVLNIKIFHLFQLFPLTWNNQDMSIEANNLTPNIALFRMLLDDNFSLFS